jgi:sulfide dehydrogenase [flavocytochrome c] flavoprotein chain
MNPLLRKRCVRSLPPKQSGWRAQQARRGIGRSARADLHCDLTRCGGGKALLSRRRIVGSAAAAAAMLWPRGVAAASPRIVIVGGGFAGASCARALREIDDRLGITLVEARRTYTALPLSNGVLGGIRQLADQQFSYERIAATGVKVAFASATAVDPRARRVTLSTGDRLPYDRLVLAPGIDFHWDALPGYDQAAAAQLPHAWTTDGEQIQLLRRQIEAMDDGGVVVIVVPVNPTRCPPGPYERASMIAYYLKSKKPRSKIVILDDKENFSMQPLFQNAWKELYPGLIDWVSPSSGGDVASVDVANKTIATDFDTYKFAVANVIPRQKAAQITVAAGVADRTGWCPIDPLSFESLLQKNIHVIGDAALAGAMPKSAFAGSVQGKLCAAAIARLLAGEVAVAPKLVSNCYSIVAPDYAISIAGVYQPVEGQYLEVKGAGGVSPLAAPPALRAEEAKYADAWFRTNTFEIFG